MSIFRPYPNQQPRSSGLAPFQTSASGFYPFEGSTPQQINRGADARAILPALGIAALLTPAPVFVPAAQVQQSARSAPAIQQQTFISELAPFFSAGSPSVPLPRTVSQQAAYLRIANSQQQPESEIAPLIPAPTALVPPAQVLGAFARAPFSALPLPAAGPAATDDTVLVVCGDATQPIAPYIRAPAPPLPQTFSVVAPLAVPPAFTVPPSILARAAGTIYSPPQVAKNSIAPFVTTVASAPLPCATNMGPAFVRSAYTVQLPMPGPAVFDDSVLVVCGDAVQSVAAYIRGPAAPLPQVFSIVAPLAVPPVLVVPAAAIARTPETTYPPQIIEYDVAQFLSGIASAPPILPMNPQAAYLRAAPFVQQSSSDIAPLIAPPAQFVFAGSIVGLYARLSGMWPQPKFESAALAAAAPPPPTPSLYVRGELVPLDPDDRRITLIRGS
jgi:hypothetical protein